MREINYKRWLYFGCFVMLNLIEFLKATQNGDVWYVAVNCTGLVVMVIVLSAYQLRAFVDRVNIAYTAVCAVAMIGVYPHWREHIGTYNLWQIQTAILNIWWIGIMVRRLIQDIVISKTRKIRIPYVGWMWIVLSILMICSVSRRIWPLWFLFMFGIFYLTEYTSKDRKDLWDGMMNGTILSFFCIQIYAYGFRPYDVVRYLGAYGNCNSMALYYLIVYCMVICKLYHLRKAGAKRIVRFFFWILAGGLLSFELFTLCRTAWLISGIITLTLGFLALRNDLHYSCRQLFTRLCVLGTIVVLTFLPVYETIRWLPTILHHPIWYEGEYSVDKVHSFDPADSEKYISLDEFVETAMGRLVRMVRKADLYNPFVIHAKASDLEYVQLVDIPWTQDESTRIRMTVYKTYLRDMKWFGNGPDKGYYMIDKIYYRTWHAQNLWLQIGFTYGIPSGLMCILITFALLVYHIQKYRHNKSNPYAILPLLICIMFFGVGLTEIVWNLGQLILFLMFFVQHPQFYNKPAENE